MRVVMLSDAAYSLALGIGGTRYRASAWQVPGKCLAENGLEISAENRWESRSPVENGEREC